MAADVSLDDKSLIYGDVSDNQSKIMTETEKNGDEKPREPEIISVPAPLPKVNPWFSPKHSPAVRKDRNQKWPDANVRRGGSVATDDDNFPTLDAAASAASPASSAHSSPHPRYQPKQNQKKPAWGQQTALEVSNAVAALPTFLENAKDSSGPVKLDEVTNVEKSTPKMDKIVDATSNELKTAEIDPKVDSNRGDNEDLASEAIEIGKPTDDSEIPADGQEIDDDGRDANGTGKKGNNKSKWKSFDIEVEYSSKATPRYKKLKRGLQNGGGQYRGGPNGRGGYVGNYHRGSSMDSENFHDENGQGGYYRRNYNYRPPYRGGFYRGGGYRGRGFNPAYRNRRAFSQNHPQGENSEDGEFEHDDDDYEDDGRFEPSADDVVDPDSQQEQQTRATNEKRDGDVKSNAPTSADAAKKEAPKVEGGNSIQQQQQQRKDDGQKLQKEHQRYHHDPDRPFRKWQGAPTGQQQQHQHHHENGSKMGVTTGQSRQPATHPTQNQQKPFFKHPMQRQVSKENQKQHGQEDRNKFMPDVAGLKSPLQKPGTNLATSQGGKPNGSLAHVTPFYRGYKNPKAALNQQGIVQKKAPDAVEAAAEDGEVDDLDDNFDYMELLDMQYAQYYAMSSVPPFDPAAPSTGFAGGHANGAPVSGVDPALAAALPGLAVAQAQADRQAAAAAAAAAAAVAIGSSAPMMSPLISSGAAILPGPVVPVAVNVPVSVLTSADSSAASSAVTSPMPLVGLQQRVGGGQAVVVPYMPLPAFSPVVPFIPVSEETLKEYVRKQIEYYFSEENLQKDFFLRRKMDSEGYLPVALVASFHRVQSLTSDLPLIIEALRDSDRVELSRDCLRVRTRHNPAHWPMNSMIANVTNGIHSRIVEDNEEEELAFDEEDGPKKKKKGMDGAKRKDRKKRKRLPDDLDFQFDSELSTKDCVDVFGTYNCDYAT